MFIVRPKINPKRCHPKERSESRDLHTELTGNVDESGRSLDSHSFARDENLFRLNNRAPLKTTLLCFGRIFCRSMRFEKPTIHPVFLRFQNFCWNKISRPKHQKVVFRGRQYFSFSRRNESSNRLKSAAPDGVLRTFAGRADPGSGRKSFPCRMCRSMI